MNMPRKVFDQELERLGVELAEMGRQVDALMAGTIRCLKGMDLSAAHALFPRDAEINAREKGIEQKCASLIALQQPLARDLRVIMATLKIITDMERIADQCADICEIVSTVEGLTEMEAPPRILHMFEKAREMFRGALDAFLRRDEAAARSVCGRDDEVDGMFSAAVAELCRQIRQSPAEVPQNVDFLFVAKYVERMADHATNIAEWAIYIVTGRHPNLNDTMGEEPMLDNGTQTGYNAR